MDSLLNLHLKDKVLLGLTLPEIQDGNSCGDEIACSKYQEKRAVHRGEQLDAISLGLVTFHCCAFKSMS
jgi:hypothetical protein